jgi:hypothetical protein
MQIFDQNAPMINGRKSTFNIKSSYLCQACPTSKKNHIGWAMEGELRSTFVAAKLIGA